MSSRLSGWDIIPNGEQASDIFFKAPNSLSPAQLNLERVFEQNRPRNQQLQNGGPATETANPGVPMKGKPRLLLMGQRRYDDIVDDDRLDMLILSRSGKSSIASVVFHKLPPSETLFLESTARIQKDAMS